MRTSREARGLSGKLSYQGKMLEARIKSHAEKIKLAKKAKRKAKMALAEVKIRMLRLILEHEVMVELRYFNCKRGIAPHDDSFKLAKEKDEKRKKKVPGK